jgi:hypothetical protein
MKLPATGQTARARKGVVKGSVLSIDSAEKPLFFEISQTASEMLRKLSLQNALQSILQERVARFSGVFNCSFLISWGFSAESV